MNANPWHLYRDTQHQEYFYLMINSDSQAFVFEDFGSGRYRYMERINLTGEYLEEVNEGFQLFWAPFFRFDPQYQCLHLTFEKQIPSKGIAFLDIDGLLEHIRVQQEKLYLYPVEEEFDFLGRFFYNNGKVHYHSFREDRAIFEKILKCPV